MSVKSLPASLLLSLTAIIQALGIFRYEKDSMALSGHIFFPILFALMASYLGWRNRKAEERYPLAHIIILALSVIALAVTITGMSATLYYFYPSYPVFYTAFALLVLELALCIASTPKKTSDPDAPKARRSRQKNRGTNLVAVKKTATAQKTD